MVPENASGLGTRQIRGRDRPADGRREGGRATSNGHVERLQRRIVTECWRPALTRSREASLTALQRDLDDYLETYNSTETDGLGRGRVPEGALGNGARNGSSEHSTNGSGRIVGYERPRGRERAG